MRFRGVACVGGVALMAMTISGCFFSGGSSGNLSDAMKSSASGGEQSFSSSNSRARSSSDPFDDDDDDGFSFNLDGVFDGVGSSGSPRNKDDGQAVGGLDLSDGIGQVEYDEKTFGWMIPVGITYYHAIDSDFRSLTKVTLSPLSMETERQYISLYLGGGPVKFKNGSLPDQAVKDVWTMDLGLHLRHYFNDPQTAFSPYLSGRVAGQIMVWDYRNPVIIDGDEKSGDALPALEGYIGLGVSTKRENAINFFAEAGMGGAFFVGRTFHGFSDDVFNGYWFASGQVGVSIKF